MALLAFLAQRGAIIEIMTNGLRFAAAPFVARALAFPLACLSIPVYGLDATHDALVGRTRSFQCLLRALDRITARPHIHLNLKLLVTRSNYRQIPEVLAFLFGRYGKQPSYTLNTLIYGENARDADSWIPLRDAEGPLSETIGFALGKGLNFSLAFVPACALPEQLLSDRLLEFFALCRAAHSHKPGSAVRLISPSHPWFEDIAEDVLTPAMCRDCDLNAMCLKLHIAAADIPETRLGLRRVRLDPATGTLKFCPGH
jgi:hypothetical protein